MVCLVSCLTATTPWSSIRPQRTPSTRVKYRLVNQPARVHVDVGDYFSLAKVESVCFIAIILPSMTCDTTVTVVNIKSWKSVDGVVNFADSNQAVLITVLSGYLWSKLVSTHIMHIQVYRSLELPFRQHYCIIYIYYSINTSRGTTIGVIAPSFIYIKPTISNKCEFPHYYTTHIVRMFHHNDNMALH